MAQRPNTTQRSWSNYVGDNPKKSWVSKSPVGEARFYSDSGVHGPGGSYTDPNETYVPEGYELDAETGGIRRKKTPKSSNSSSFLKRDLPMKSLERKRAMQRALSEIQKSKVIEEDAEDSEFTV